MTVANPYAPPTARVEDSLDVGDAEVIRRAHIAHETSVRAFGALYLVSGMVAVLMSVWIALFGITIPFSLLPVALSLKSRFLTYGLLAVAAGQGVWRLRPWARSLVVVSAIFGTLIAPTAIFVAACSSFLLLAVALLLSAKGRFVFSSKYARAVATTPHVGHQASPLLWVFWRSAFRRRVRQCFSSVLWDCRCLGCGETRVVHLIVMRLGVDAGVLSWTR